MLRLLPLSFVVAAVGFVPADAAPPTAPAPRPVLSKLDPALADWTPRPAGKGEPWERATDKDWIDPRFRQMDTGPFLNCTMEYPLGAGKERVPKALVLKLAGGKAGVVYDRATMRLCAGWTGGYLQHSDRRFGLLNTPTPKGELAFASPDGPGWAGPNGSWATGTTRFTAPLPSDWVKYRILGVGDDGTARVSYTVGETGVIETVTAAVDPRFGEADFTVEVYVDRAPVPLKRHVLTLPTKYDLAFPSPLVIAVSDREKTNQLGIAVVGETDGVELRVESGIVYTHIPRSRSPRRLGLIYRRTPDPKAITSMVADLPKWSDWVKSAHVRMLTSLMERKGKPPENEPLVTTVERGTDAGPLAIDTIKLPYTNPYGALFFCTGVDFLPDGRVAVCTCHGDVWLVKVDDTAGTATWERYATGLYHPLGLKVVDETITVLERGQLTRVYRTQGPLGTSTVYQCLSNDWHTGTGEHAYDTCLETDPQGNFYFFKTGDTHLPHGGCLLRVGKDGGPAEVFATGFRHPIGLGMSPTGIVTGADQEGNWMPATRIDEYRRGGFYGDMRAHHRTTPPKTFDPPLCWLPREVDNSAGGQSWVPKNAFGPLGGLPLHFSYGRCKAFVLLRQETAGGVVQGGAVDLGLTFLSGVCRGRFHPKDGHLYVCGLNGWQTAAKADGCLQRVRLTGKPLDVPVKLAIEGNDVRLTFSRPLDRATAADPKRFQAAWWNYRWSGEYGSKRWKVSDPKAEGQDEVPVKSARLLDDGRTVVLTFAELRPVMQMQVGYNVVAADGKGVTGSVFLTINSTKK